MEADGGHGFQVEALEPRWLLCAADATQAFHVAAAGVAQTEVVVPAVSVLDADSFEPVTSVQSDLMLSEADFDRMRAKINAGEDPWLTSWNWLIGDGYSQLGSNPRPLETVIRGGDGQNFNQLVIDIQRTYQLALRWKISGDTAYAEEAVRYLNAWSSTNTELTGNSDRFLASGLYAFDWAQAASIMKSYSGWDAAEVTQFENYLVNVFYPLQHDFLVNHNGARITNYWANWDLANIQGMMAVGIFSNRADIYNEAVDYLYHGGGNGALDKAFYYRHAGNLYQWQESGRDQGHTILGMALFGHIAQMAWNQGQDLFAYNNYQFLAAAEYVAKYNLGFDVPYETYIWGKGQGALGAWPYDIQSEVGSYARGHSGTAYALIVSHYVQRLGMDAPYSLQRVASLGIEGRNNGDDMGWGTLTYTLDGFATAQPPRGLTATEKGRGNIRLDWFGGANVDSYNLYRSTSETGTYTLIASGIDDLLTYTDYDLAPGTYYYKVTGVAGGTETAETNIVSATATALLDTQLSFDENTGTTAGDSTGNGNAGTLENGAAWTTGKSGSAVLLDGIDDYVSLPEGIVADFDDFTIATWVYLDAADTWSRIFDFGDDRGRYMFLTPRNGDGVVQFTTSTIYGYNNQSITGSASLPTDQWVHVAVALEDNVGRLYINGFLVAANTNMSFPPAQIRSTPRNWIGRSQYSNDAYLDGNVDDFRIYEGAMTTAELYTLATGQTAPVVSAAPQTLTATAIAGGQVELVWSEVERIQGYTVKRATTNGGPYTVIATRLTGTSFTDTNLTPGVEYFYVVAADNYGGESAHSPEASAVALPEMPAAPGDLRAVPTSSADVLLSWASASNADSYSIKRSTSSDGIFTTIASGVTSLNYTDESAVAGQTYYYSASAVNAAGESTDTESTFATPSDILLNLKLDETTGTAVSDSSGNDFSGTLVNGPVWEAGRSGNAVAFDGSDDYVSLSSGIVSGLTTATFSAWINIDAYATWQRVFDFGTGTDNYMFLATQYTGTSPNNQKLRFAIRTPSVGEQGIQSSVAIPTGVWTHVAVVLNGSTGTLYVNGEQVGQNTNMTLDPSVLGNTTQNYLGKSQWNDPYFVGKIDDFRIYTRALTSSEVAAMMSLAGDLDGDGYVGLADLDLVLGRWNNYVREGTAADPSGDGFVGLDDLDIVLSNWNAGTPPMAGQQEQMVQSVQSASGEVTQAQEAQVAEADSAGQTVPISERKPTDTDAHGVLWHEMHNRRTPIVRNGRGEVHTLDILSRSDESDLLGLWEDGV